MKINTFKSNKSIFSVFLVCLFLFQIQTTEAQSRRKKKEKAAAEALAAKAKKTEKKVSYVHALVIGISQAIAILPGISRSGATISTSVLLGIDREKAARFSFLMVVPLIFGKIAKDLLSDELITESVNWSALSLGFFAAFFTGLVACTWMIQLVKRSKLTYFAIYCLVVGAIAIIWSFAG